MAGSDTGVVVLALSSDDGIVSAFILATSATALVAESGRRQTRKNMCDRNLFIFGVLCKLFAGFAEAAFSLLVIINRLVELFFFEFWPADVREIKFGIGNLPHQKVAYSVFAAGSD